MIPVQPQVTPVIHNPAVTPMSVLPQPPASEGNIKLPVARLSFETLCQKIVNFKLVSSVNTILEYVNQVQDPSFEQAFSKNLTQARDRLIIKKTLFQRIPQNQAIQLWRVMLAIHTHDYPAPDVVVWSESAKELYKFLGMVRDWKWFSKGLALTKALEPYRVETVGQPSLALDLPCCAACQVAPLISGSKTQKRACADCQSQMFSRFQYLCRVAECYVFYLQKGNQAAKPFEQIHPASIHKELAATTLVTEAEGSAIIKAFQAIMDQWLIGSQQAQGQLLGFFGCKTQEYTVQNYKTRDTKVPPVLSFSESRTSNFSVVTATYRHDSSPRLILGSGSSVSLRVVWSPQEGKWSVGDRVFKKNTAILAEVAKTNPVAPLYESSVGWIELMSILFTNFHPPGCQKPKKAAGKALGMTLVAKKEFKFE